MKSQKQTKMYGWQNARRNSLLQLWIKELLGTFFFFIMQIFFTESIGLKDRRKTFLPDVLPKNKQTNKQTCFLPISYKQLSVSWCLVIFAGWYSVAAKWAFQHVWENWHPVLGNPKCSACWCRNLHMHSGKQCWEGLCVCRAHCPRYSKDRSTGEQKWTTVIALKNLWLCFQYKRLLFFSSYSLFIRWYCDSLEHATAENIVLV